MEGLLHQSSNKYILKVNFGYVGFLYCIVSYTVIDKPEAEMTACNE